MTPSNPADVVREVQERMSTLLNADRHVTEVLEILRDTHRILRKLEDVVDRFADTAESWERRLAGLEVSPERLDRLETAVFNIERATLGVEGAMNALPKSVLERIRRERPTP